MRCLSCKNGQLDSLWNMGDFHQSGFVKRGELTAMIPLHLVQCGQCGLVQLNDIIDLDSAYRQYWYMSSLNSTMMVALKDLAKDAWTKADLHDGDTVIDIGCNDGGLLSLYPKTLRRIGFDPALNLKDRAGRSCDEFVNDYFSASTINGRKAKAISAIAMFYDLPDPHKFLADVCKCLDSDGIFVIQLTDLYGMLSKNAFDNICHEHLEYYSLRVLKNLLNQHGLDVFDISRNDANGSSARVFSCFSNRRMVDGSVSKWLLNEDAYLESDSFQDFVCRVNAIRPKVIDYLREKRTFVLGASTKGNTLLQYFGIDRQLVPYAAEVNPDKFGLFTAGTGIEIVPESEALRMRPEAFLVLPWHFKDKMVHAFRDFIEKGGELLFPLPVPHAITIDGPQYL